MTTDEQVYETGGARLGELRQRWIQCLATGTGWDRQGRNQRVRRAEWDGQAADGKKHDAEDDAAFPWDGASDTRVLLADEVVNENAAIGFVAFFRALLQAQPSGPGELEESAQASKLLDWVLHKLRRELADEVEFAAQWLNELGWVVLHVYWDREVTRYNRVIKLAELEALAQAAGARDPASALAQLTQMTMDPSLEPSAGALLHQLYNLYVQAELRGFEVEPPELPAKRFERMARELREAGEAHVPMPMVLRNQPAVVALKPYEDVLLPPGCSRIREADVVFRRVFLTEAELRAEGRLDGWDADWVERAAQQKGKVTLWTQGGTWNTAATELEADRELIEIWYAYRRLLDDDDVPGVWVTVYHPLIEHNDAGAELCAKHELLEYLHGRMPFALGRRECLDRPVATSRGVPEILEAPQREIKVQRDSLVDRTSFSTLPSILRPAGINADYRFGPARQIEYAGGRKPEFMVPTGTPIEAWKLIDLIQTGVDNYFGRLSATVPPARSQTKQQMAAEKFLLLWMEAIDLVYALLKQFLPAETVERLTGQPPLWHRSGSETAAGLDVQLSFDVKELDSDYVLKKLEMISKFVLPEDSAGVVDRAKLTALKLRALDPTLARELTSDVGAASQAMFRGVMQDVALMALGNEAEYTENDPAAAMKLRFLTQIVQRNPKYQQALAQDERFKGLLLNYEQNLKQSVVQQENKMVGRLGVKPMEGQ